LSSRYRLAWGIGASLLLLASTASSDLVKGGTSAPSMPGTLGVTIARDASDGAFAKRKSEASCTAGIVDLADAGPSIVTAKHCLGRSLVVFDDEDEVAIEGHREAEGEIDVALLQAEASLHTAALPTRASSSLRRGERLCGYRIEKKDGHVVRQRICGRFLRFATRDGAPPLLLVGTPFPRGASGSPLLDEEGHVVGVVVATQDAWGLAEPIEAAASLTHTPSRP